MQNHVITQQIDVIVLGEMKWELVSLLLDQQFSTKSHSQTQEQRSSQSSAEGNLGQKTSKKEHTYVELLSKLLGSENLLKDITFSRGENIKQIEPKTGKMVKKSSKFPIYTKIILTETFWLHIHFFIHSYTLLDPFIFDSTKGNISICLIASQQSADLVELKHYLHTNSQNPLPSTANSHTSGSMKHTNAIIKPEMIIQGKIYSMIHEMNIAGFPSVLSLKITEESRIIEDNSNLRLTTNQILRWIVDRYFENRYKIKLKQNLGDQIQYMEEKQEKSYCQII